MQTREDLQQIKRIAEWQATQQFKPGYTDQQKRAFVKQRVLWDTKRYEEKQPSFEPLLAEPSYHQDYSAVSFQSLLESLEDPRAESLLFAVYKHGYKISEWGEANQVNTSTASKIHQKALSKLKETLSCG